MALLVGNLIPRRASCNDWQGVHRFCIYLLAILANAVHTQSNNVTTSAEIEYMYTTIVIPDSTLEMLVSSASIPTSSSPSSSAVGSFSFVPSTAPYPSSSFGISEMLTSDIAAYTSYSASEMTSELSAFGTASVFSSPTAPMLSTSVLSQSSVAFQASQTFPATSFVVSSVEMLVTSSKLSNPSSPAVSENLSSLMSSTEFLSPSPSSSETSSIFVIRTSSVSLPTTSQAPSSSSSSLWSSSPPPLYSPSPPLSYMPSPSSIALINATSSGATFTATPSLSPTSILPTPSPTMDTSSQPSITTAGPDQLSILEWFGIAVGGAAVLFILFLLFHCYQVRQRTIRRQKKEMKKEILDFSQSNRNDRITSWRKSLALDAMATHIELPQEDSMDMQAMDNLGFEEVFLGDEPKSSANNNYFLPQTNL